MQPSSASAKPAEAVSHTELAQLREQYRSGKTALLVAWAQSRASTRGIRARLQKLARHTDATLQQLWLRAGFPADFTLVTRL